jgi:hypothetical protein
MVAGVKNDLLPGAGCELPTDVINEAFLVARASRELELEETFRRMRDESARTLTLIDRLRLSPHSRYASAAIRADDFVAWPRR